MQRAEQLGDDAAPDGELRATHRAFSKGRRRCGLGGHRGGRGRPLGRGRPSAASDSASAAPRSVPSRGDLDGKATIRRLAAVAMMTVPRTPSSGDPDLLVVEDISDPGNAGPHQQVRGRPRSKPNSARHRSKMYPERPRRRSHVAQTASQTTTSAMWVVRSLPSTLPSKWRSVASSVSGALDAGVALALLLADRQGNARAVTPARAR